MQPPLPLLDLSDDDLVQAIVGHDAFLISTLVRLSGIELHEDDEATWYCSGVPDALFNGVLRTSMREQDADRGIDLLLARFREAGVPASWWAGPLSTPSDLGDRLAVRGLTGTTMPGMALDLSRFAGVPVPDGLVVEVVAGEAGIDSFMAASGEAYEIPPADRDRYRRTPEAVVAGDIPGWCVTGFVDERPVATATVCIGTGVAGLSNIATLPSHRRRGIGAAVTAHALGMARDRGYETAVLTSTASGRPLYEALGFAERCRVDVFEFRPPGLNGPTGESS